MNVMVYRDQWKFIKVSQKFIYILSTIENV